MTTLPQLTTRGEYSAIGDQNVGSARTVRRHSLRLVLKTAAMARMFTPPVVAQECVRKIQNSAHSTQCTLAGD